MRKFLRGLALLVLGLVVLIAGFATFIALKPLPSYSDFPKQSVSIVVDSATLALGQKLAVMNCTGCHMNEEHTSFSGKLFPDRDAAALGTIYTSNITQDTEHGIGAYSADELYHLFRTGIKRDGSLALPMMSGFALTSDADLKALIAFLQSDHALVKPNSTSHPAFEPAFITKALFNFAWKPTPYPEAAVVSPDPNGDEVDYGRYLAMGRYYCYGCHSTDFEGLSPTDPESSPGYLAGGYTFNVEFAGESYSVVAPSLLDDGFMGQYGESEFLSTVMWGRHPRGTGLKEPMHPYTMIDTAEAKAIYAYLLNYEAHDAVSKAAY